MSTDAGFPRARVLAAGACLALLSGCALWTPEPAFRETLPAEVDDADTIAVIGDLQLTPAWVRSFRGREDNSVEQQVLMTDMLERVDELAALVIVGDLVFSPGANRDWTHFDEIVSPIAARVPVLPAIGNHDYRCILIYICFHRAVPRRYRARFPWVRAGKPYEVAYGDIALYFLDSERDLDAQSTWLAERLAMAEDRFSVAIVFFHRPPFSNSIDLGAKGLEAAVQYVVPVLESAPVPVVVVNGHIHGYERLRIDGIDYVTTAGGGGPRGPLGAARPNDLYAGPDCRTEPDGSVIRPLNYLLITRNTAGLDLEVRGLCKDDPGVSVLESVEVPIPRARSSQQPAN